ncbi:hypothetical protein PG995_003119 [Apiospora arundinis]
MALPMKTDKTPFMSGARVEMLSALDCSSYYELLLALSKNASVLSHHTNSLAGMTSAQQKIEGDRANGRALAMLLHCIPPTLMRSIVAGTVAHDFLDRSTPSPDVYSADGAGTYVAGIAIQGRDDGFLTYPELSDLVAALEDYCKSYKLQKRRGGQPPTNPSEILADTIARQIDDEFGGRVPSKPDSHRWIPNDDALRRVELFVASLKDRLASIDRDGLSRTTIHIQSPLMVGCSKLLRDRMPHHTGADGSSLRSTTYTWGLTLCCIQACLQLTPRPVVQPVVHVWRNEHLPISEVLVTALAGSYCFQDGFNVIGAGTSSGVASMQTLLDSKHYMFCQEPYFKANAAATTKELEKRAEYIADIWLCADFYDAALKREIQDLETQIEQTKVKGYLWEELVKKVARKEEGLRAESDRLATEIKAKRARLKIYDFLLDKKRPSE